MKSITAKQFKLLLSIAVLVIGLIVFFQASSLSLSPGVAHAAVSVDGSASTFGGAITNSSFSHTVGSGDNRLLIVGVSLLDADPQKQVGSVTYGGSAMTEFANIAGSNIRIQIFQLVNPSVGTDDVSVTIANGQKNKVGIGALSFVGVDQDTPLEGAVSDSGEQRTPSVSVGSEDGDFVMDVLGTDKLLPSVGAGQVLRWTVEQEGNKEAGASTEEGSTSTVMSWAEVPGKFTQVGFNINQHVSSGNGGGEGSTGSGSQETRVRFSGESYPDSEVYFLGITDSGSVTEIVNEPFRTESDGRFDYTAFPNRSFPDFAIQVVDSEGRITPMLTLEERRLSDNRIVIEEIIPSPTLSLVGDTIPIGESLSISGYALKDSVVQLRVDGVIIEEVMSAPTGNWSYELDKRGLELGPHTISVRHEKGSQWSNFVDFYLSPLRFLAPDLNEDHRVNELDLDIFLSKWSAGEEEKASLDMNDDGSVGVADFSIFLEVLNS